MRKILNWVLLSMMMAISLHAVPKQSKILTPEEAFNFTAIQSGEAIVVTLGLGEQIYLYDEHLKFDIIKPVKASLDKDINRPKPVDYKEFIVHREKDQRVFIPFNIIRKHVQNGPFDLQISWQGCSEMGLCYQPMTKVFSFDLGGGSTATTVAADSTQELSEQDAIAKTLASGNMLWVLLTFFGFGLLLSLTPCIFPMIPILSSIIVSQSGEAMSAKRGFFLSAVYVLAMAGAYTIAGVLAGMFGANIQTALQMPSVIWAFSLIFVALSFSMFGFYELQLPASWQSAASKKSDSMQGHGVVGVAVMGFLSALIVGPCVAAPLAGALIYIGQSGDAILGGAALFVMSIGMGVPLLIIGASAGKLLPKPGMWMDNVKAAFGVMMLAVAIWMLSRVIPGQVSMLLWAVLAIGSAVYMGALQPLKEGVVGWFKLIKTMAIILLVYGLMLFIGAMTKSTNPLDPLKNIGGTSSAVVAQSTHTQFQRVATVNDLETIVKNSPKPVMLDFYADWCVSCIELEEYTFSDPKVAKVLEGFTLLQADVTKNTEDDKALLKKFGLFGPPGIIFWKEGEELKNLQLVGFKDADEFLVHLQKVLQ